MQTQKINFANIKGKLSRAEMKNIIAGECGLSNVSVTHQILIALQVK